MKDMKGLDFVASQVLVREFPFSVSSFFIDFPPESLAAVFCETTPFRAHLLSQVVLKTLSLLKCLHGNVQVLPPGGNKAFFGTCSGRRGGWHWGARFRVDF